MPALIIYLLKVNIALLLFFLAYRFALRRLTFYTLNRFFLVSGIVFASFYPFIKLTNVFKNQPELNNNRVINIVRDFSPVQQVSERFNTPPEVTQTSSFRHAPEKISAMPAVDYWQLAVMLFWSGVALCVLRLAIQLFSLYRIHRYSKPEIVNNYTFRRINGKVNPFSFWQSIYVNPEQHTLEEFNSILKHEQVHIKEWHTLDILLAEISTIFYWFNPGVWLMKRAVRQNLEFITDRKVLQDGLDSKIYQYNLVRISSLPQSYALVNNFNFLSLKKRILMMNKKQSQKAQVIRYFFLLPLIILVSLAFTISKAGSEKQASIQSGIPAPFSALQEAGGIINLPDDESQFLNHKDDIVNGVTDRINDIPEIVSEETHVEPKTIQDKIVYYYLYVVDGVPIISVNSRNNADDIVPDFKSLMQPDLVTFIKQGKYIGSRILNEWGRSKEYLNASGFKRDYQLRWAGDFIERSDNYVSSATFLSIKPETERMSITDTINLGLTPIIAKAYNEGTILVKDTIKARELTPNDDGINDKYVINNLDKYITNSIWIFNALGEKVFEKMNYNNDWNGKSINGTDLPTGRYYVVLNVDHGKRTFRGTIALKR